MRIVLDTNVVVSGLLWRNTPYRLLQRAVDDEAIELFSSPALLGELAEVLGRAHLAAKIEAHTSSVEALIALYGTAVQLVSPAAPPPRIAPDPDDDEAIACALAAGAKLLVTGDRTLLALKQHQDVEIVTPAQALQRLAA